MQVLCIDKASFGQVSSASLVQDHSILSDCCFDSFPLAAFLWSGSRLVEHRRKGYPLEASFLGWFPAYAPSSSSCERCFVRCGVPQTERSLLILRPKVRFRSRSDVFEHALQVRPDALDANFAIDNHARFAPQSSSTSIIFLPVPSIPSDILVCRHAW